MDGVGCIDQWMLQCLHIFRYCVLDRDLKYFDDVSGIPGMVNDVKC